MPLGDSSKLKLTQGQTDYPEDDWLALSGIQHYAFCKRQWALIHIEQLWDENARTAAGQIEHKRVDDYEQSEARGNLLTLRSLRVFSRKLGITGICDAVDFHRDKNGVKLHGRKGTWLAYPVEYKHGRPKVKDEDRLQLCAEAMCLEEMLSCNIPQAALYYQQTRRREIVELDDQLRGKVVDTTRQMHDLYRRGHTPVVKRTRSCNACSLKNICLPELSKAPSAMEYIKTNLESD